MSISIVSQDSVQCELGLEIEWSVDEESELLVHALGSILDVMAIDNSPFLVGAIMFWVNNNALHFSVLVSSDI